MRGLRIEHSHPRRFVEVFGTVIDDLDRFYWLIDTQSGPFNTSDKANWRELDAEIDEYYVRVPQLEDSSAGLWRPGILRFADLLVIDECTYLVGLLGEQNNVIAALNEVLLQRVISAQLFDLIQKSESCALLHLYGWWEAYSRNSALMANIAQIEGASETESEDLMRNLYSR